MACHIKPRFTFATVLAGAIDGEAGILSGVSVITEGPALGHGVLIDSTSLESVKACAEQYRGGLKVKMDHGSGAGSILGVLRNFRIDGIQLRADLHLLKSHPQRSLVLEMAETMPDGFGLSISFSGQLEERSGEQFVRCLEIYSCDIVDSPAANPTGLFAALVDTPREAMATETLESVIAERDLAREQAKANFQSLKDAQARNEALMLVESANEALLVNLDTLKGEYATFKSETDTKISALTEANTQLTNKLEEAQKDFVQKVNDGITRELAKSGHAPISGAVTEGVTTQEKPFANLTGLEKAIAAHKASKS